MTTPELVNIIIGDYIAQQAGRYKLKGWLRAADTAIRQHANLNESSAGDEGGSAGKPLRKQLYTDFIPQLKMMPF